MGQVFNRRRYMGGGVGTLPYDYEVEYIQSTGTQYINTGIVPSNDMDLSFHIEFEPLEQANGKAICGTYYNWQHQGFSFYFYNTWRAVIGSSSVQLPSIGLERDVVDYDGISTITANGENRSLSVGTIVTNVPLFLFAENKNGSVAGLISARLTAFKLGSVLDCIAVSKNGVGYMYDKIRGQLHGSQSADDFIAGPRL